MLKHIILLLITSILLSGCLYKNYDLNNNERIFIKKDDLLFSVEDIINNYKVENSESSLKIKNYSLLSLEYFTQNKIYKATGITYFLLKKNKIKYTCKDVIYLDENLNIFDGFFYNYDKKLKCKNIN